DSAAAQARFGKSEPLGGEDDVRLGDDDLEPRAPFEKRKERLGIEVIRVVVARGDDIDLVEARGIDHTLGDADVRLVGRSVLPRQRIGEVRIEDEAVAVPGDEETALPEPPERELILFRWRATNLGEEIVVFAERALQSSSSSRTRFTPATMLRSFSRAAQRAVWLKPQSGASESFSAGTCSRQSLTRAAMSSGVSM